MRNLEPEFDGLHFHFQHPGRGDYPSLKAYSDFFGKRGAFISQGIDWPKSTSSRPDVGWSQMGVQRTAAPASFIVHDYRGLSVKPGAALKDRIKRLINCKPDLRIYQNRAISDILRFQDGTAEAFIPMGVPDWIFDVRAQDADRPGARFCYLGAINRERKFDLVLDSYLRNKKGFDGELVLRGEPEPAIRKEYEGRDGLHFVGRLPQQSALALVASCDFAVNYFPVHRPHLFQTPTKLLEYAALGVKVLCNPHPMSTQVVESTGIPVTTTSPFIFDGLSETVLRSGERTAPQKLGAWRWEALIANSGVLSVLSEARQKKT